MWRQIGSSCRYRLQIFSVGLIVAPSYIAYTFWIDGANFELLVMFDNLLLYASVGNLCITTFDPYIDITRPLRYASSMDISMALRLIALAWVLPIMITLMPLCWKKFKWSLPAVQDTSKVRLMEQSKWIKYTRDSSAFIWNSPLHCYAFNR